MMFDGELTTMSIRKLVEINISKHVITFTCFSFPLNPYYSIKKGIV